MRKVILALSIVASPISAQVPAYVGSWYTDFGANEFYRASLIANQNVRKQTPDSPLPPTTQAAELTQLNFTSSARQRRANYASFVERSRRTDPTGAVNLAETLKGDPIALMGPELAKVGLSTSNVADAYTVYWVEAWQAVHGVTGASSRATAQAVRQQAATAILATSEFANATPAQKQESADSLLVQALLVVAAREHAQGDPAQLAKLSSAVEQGARASGLDLRAMVLAENGFRPAR